MHTTITIDPIPEAQPRPAVRRARLHIEDPRQAQAQTAAGRKPEWLRIKLNQNDEYWRLKSLMRGQTLHTVCEEAFCPNLGECWGRA